MASKRQVRRRECGDKKRYASSADAVAAAGRIGRAKGEKLVAYRCRFCRQYHIGHPPVAVQQKLGYSHLLHDVK
jgi:hypothetical protein